MPVISLKLSCASHQIDHLRQMMIKRFSQHTKISVRKIPVNMVYRKTGSEALIRSEAESRADPIDA